MPLALRGYKVFAQDLSASMIEIARAKVETAGLNGRVTLRRGDMRAPNAEGQFDACLCMFASIGYLPDLQDTLKALKAMRHHLRAGGLLVLDCWNGPAVMTTRPIRRTKTIRRKEITIIRRATPQLFPLRNSCRVDYNILVKKRSGEREEFSEKHMMRYFFPDEIRLLLSLSLFELVSLHPFRKPSLPLRIRDWNVTAVARAI